jgi:hypothetical protein
MAKSLTTVYVDQEQTFGHMYFLQCTPKNDHKTGAQLATSDGTPKWEVELLTVVSNMGRAESEVIKVGIAHAGNPCPKLAAMTTVRLVGLQFGSMDRVRNGQSVGSQTWLRCTGIEPVEALASTETNLRRVILAVVGGIGMAAGFQHTILWAVHNGQAGWLAAADAVVIESMVVVSGLELRRKPGPLPWTVLVVGFLLQMWAQVSEAHPSIPGWVLAATPALGFLVIVKLALRQVPESTEDTRAPVTAIADREDQSPREAPRGTTVATVTPMPVPATWPPR